MSAFCSVCLAQEAVVLTLESSLNMTKRDLLPGAAQGHGSEHLVAFEMLFISCDVSALCVCVCVECLFAILLAYTSVLFSEYNTLSHFQRQLLKEKMQLMLTTHRK